MNSVSINNKEYFKASSVAREFGYTTDYLGQLCRAGKIDAELVGRSWYVDKRSLEEHKGGRYRSAAKKSKEALAAAKQSTLTDPAQQPRKSFYSRLPVHSVYEADDADLHPIIKTPDTNKVTTVPVELADAEKVRVISDSKKTSKLKATERPAVRFKGSIAVEAVVDEVESTKSAEDESKDVSKKPAPKTVKKTTRRTKKPAPKARTVSVQTVSVTEATDGTAFRFQYLLISGVCASLLLVMGLLATAGLHVEVVATAESVSDTVQFKLISLEALLLYVEK